MPTGSPAGASSSTAPRCRSRHNERGNHLHGGPDGFDRRLWDVVAQDDAAATLELLSPDGDQGFPGALRARARFEVHASGVAITLSADTDATTVVNLTSHAYFNLDGEGAGTIDDHLLTLAADDYTPVDPDRDPARRPPVRGRHAVRLPSSRGDSARVRASTTTSWSVARACAPSRCWSHRRRGCGWSWSPTSPGLQVYTGDGLEAAVPTGPRRGGGGGPGPRGGVALEPQLFPDSPNRPDFPSATLRPGETYRSTIRWRFGR